MVGAQTHVLSTALPSTRAEAALAQDDKELLPEGPGTSRVTKTPIFEALRFQKQARSTRRSPLGAGMDAGVSPAQQERTHYRHDLRTLTYVTLDQGNGGIVRNLTREGMGVQVVAAVRPKQQLRVRFELRSPRVRVETRGEVVWATFSGQCGIRFLDLAPKTARQIDEWIFGNLLEGAGPHAESERTMFVESRLREGKRGSSSWSGELVAPEDDGLMVSAAPVKVIELPTRAERNPETGTSDHDALDANVSDPNYDLISPHRDSEVSESEVENDWLSQPLSGASLAWTVNSLVVVAGLLLFALVFLVVTRELPRWPFTLLAGACAFVVCFYWGFFKLCGGSSLGARLARMADVEEGEEGARFR